jgi:hypothetical protein
MAQLFRQPGPGMRRERPSREAIIKLLKCHNVKGVALPGLVPMRSAAEFVILIFERLFRVCGSLTILTDRRRACRLCITEAKRGYNRPPVLEPLHGYVFSPTHYCERGRGKLSERRSISAQQVAEPQVMTRRAELKFG